MEKARIESDTVCASVSILDAWFGSRKTNDRLLEFQIKHFEQVLATVKALP